MIYRRINKEASLFTNKKQTKDDVVAKISSLWSLLTEDEQTYLYDQLSFRVYKKNEVIYSEGETPRYLLCLVSGKAKIYKVGLSTRSQIMRIIQPVQYFGYRAYFANEQYVTNACAFETATVVQIPMKCIERVLADNNHLAMGFIRLLSIDLGISDKRSISLTQSHIRGRLAETILFLKENYGLEDDKATIAIHLSREDLASLANMTTANAIRTLSNFRTEELVITNGRKIKIVNEPKLRRIAEIG